MVVIMRSLFVHYDNGKYTIIDKGTNKVFQTIDDVLLFNAKYMRYKNIKGWHGILSEEINLSLIQKLQQNFVKLFFIPKVYYPRSSYRKSGDPIKEVAFLRLYKGEESYNTLGKTTPEKYCDAWKQPVNETDEAMGYGAMQLAAPHLG